jgi:hypothetical protein
VTTRARPDTRAPWAPASLAVALAFVLAGCAHAAGLRYTFSPCNRGFQNAVAACFYEAHGSGPIPAYDFYADSGVIEKQWKQQYESCMFRRGYNQIGIPATWQPKEPFNGVEGWPWPTDPPKSAWTWVRTAGTGDRHYYDAVCEP